MRHRLSVLPLVLSCLLLSVPAGAGERYANPHADEPIGTVRDVYSGTLFPDVQVNTFRNIDRLFPTRVVEAGTTPYPLPPADHALENFRFESRGRTYDLYDFLSLNRISGILVLKNGEVAFEKYLLGNGPDTRWMSMSVVKSITATLVGAAIADGHIDSLEDPLTRYLPVFKGSAYDGVTIRQLLLMASGVAWNEAYTNPDSDRRAMLEAQLAQQPEGTLKLMARLPRAAEPGTRWNYSTGETQVVGALVAAATGKPVAQYLSETIWQPFGMETDASWWLESADGLEIGGSGLSATLRDYARFGLFMLGGGKAGGKQVLPNGWVEEATRDHDIPGKPEPYGFMWWPLDRGAYAAIGIFGQFIYVNPTQQVVVAMWSAQPKPEGKDAVDEYLFFNALSDALE
ncbi:serine hydrolase [Parahaliea maris]|uniref:Serine hydrolase n=1 Tax=Parahaliea maris TaxID=2716870 RepID=A0A5C8ZZX1_9GAMM|nr:serine hydrolase [Parahaliea maris]TXS94153.1 serine hydrolase [Parahaliea maris]